MHQIRPNLNILTSGEQIVTARDVLAVQSTRDARVAMYALREALAQVEDYDFVIVDYPPSLDLLAVSAVLAANELALPALKLNGVCGRKERPIHAVQFA